MADSRHASERLLNLVIALVNTEGRMTKEQIRGSVAGYEQDDARAFERMFERDKDTLRELGVPVVTVSSAAHGDDQGYRIDLDAYALPAMELDASQLGVLALAAELWQDQVLDVDAGRALTKLRAVGAGSAQTEAVAGLVPRLQPAGAALRPLLDATEARQVVTFTYRAASTGDTLRRRVEPWRLVAGRGGWYLVGNDLDRHEPRVYRLNRIEGTVATAGAPGAFEVPPGIDPVGLVAHLQGEGRRTAVLAIVPERAQALRARATEEPGGPGEPSEPGEPAESEPSGPLPPPTPPGLDLVAVPFDRTADLADEIAGYGDAVVVLAPAELRAAVVQRLQAAVSMGERIAAEVGHG